MAKKYPFHGFNKGSIPLQGRIPSQGSGVWYKTPTQFLLDSISNIKFENYAN